MIKLKMGLQYQSKSEIFELLLPANTRIIIMVVARWKEEAVSHLLFFYRDVREKQTINRN